MGAGQSQLNKSMNNVFSKELLQLNTIINNVLSSDDKFVNSNYNFLFEDVCNKYTIVWEKELNKHLKVNLENLSGAIFLVPKKDLLVSEEDETEITKQELCSKISKHYLKILYILSLIKHVYDLEGNGDNSLAGIISRNIHITSNTMELQFCSIPHKDYDSQHSDKIDFGNLQGLKLLTEHFLTPVEKYAFIEQLKNIFSRKPRHKLIDSICHDALVPLDKYNKIYSQKFKNTIVCDKKSSRIPRQKNVDLMFEVVADNPILHTRYCFSKKRLIIPIDKSDSHVRHLLKLHDTMNTNYMNNVESVLAVLQMLVEKNKNGEFSLKNISNEELQSIVKDVKRTVIIFYIQSIVDYHVLLDYAKSIPNIKMSN